MSTLLILGCIVTIFIACVTVAYFALAFFTRKIEVDYTQEK